MTPPTNRRSPFPGSIRRLADRKIRDAQRRAAHQSQLILRHAAEAIVCTSSEGEVTYINPAAVRMMGMSSANRAQGKELLTPLIETCCSHGTTLSDGRERCGEAQFTRADGAQISIEYSCSAIIELGVIEGCILMFQDITTKKLLQRQLEQTQRVSSLGRLAGTVAHEFNNVLMGIGPFVEVIRRSAPENQKIQDATMRIVQSLDRGRAMTTKMLKTTSSTAPSLRPIELSAWLRAQEVPLASVLGAPIALEVQLDGECWASVDPVQLYQVLDNLAHNARDAMPDGGHFKISLTGDGPSHAGFIRLRVEDTGTGIPENILASVFEPLFTTKPGGTGFGLAVVQQVINRHGGTVHVRSSVAEGTMFEILLPGPRRLHTPGSVL